MSQNASTVRVSLFWDGEIVEDNYSVRYSIRPKAYVKFPTTTNYETLCDDEIPNNAEVTDDEDDDDVQVGHDDAFVFTREDDCSRLKTWIEPKDLNRDQCYLAIGMMFASKKALQQAVKIYCIKEMRDFKVDQSRTKIWRLVCRRRYQKGQRSYLRELLSSMVCGLSAIAKGTYDMEDNRADHYNLDTNMIAQVLFKDVVETPRIPIKDCIRNVQTIYGKTISKRKGFLGRRRAFEMIFGNWHTSFQSLPRYIAALQNFNVGTVVEWQLIEGKIFKFVFWTFKPYIDGFAHYQLVISIDGTHVYGAYDIKLLIAVGMDVNGSIFPLSFAIAANERNNTWGIFLTHLKTHVIKDRRGICVLSDRHKGILHNMDNLPGWQPYLVYHRYCLMHLKANLQSKFHNGTPKQIDVQC
ncbi:uncharacterized protein LOC132053873 [Lycium ferocissimum]|uniref:uncharacterized protein LOC132053873 n=1 Tax=Lycium ferocissimum TaxID=112874 RepID=UPI002814CF9A|nr:uncharacterized protein LOC132053873 [Lycium ferocissimum]